MGPRRVLGGDGVLLENITLVITVGFADAFGGLIRIFLRDGVSLSALDVALNCAVEAVKYLWLNRIFELGDVSNWIYLNIVCM